MCCMLPFFFYSEDDSAQVVETSVTVNNNSPIQDYVHPDDQTQPTFEMTPGFKPFTVLQFIRRIMESDTQDQTYRSTMQNYLG